VAGDEDSQPGTTSSSISKVGNGTCSNGPLTLPVNATAYEARPVTTMASSTTATISRKTR